VIDAIRAEFLRYRSLAEAAIGQVPDEVLFRQAPDGSNAIATICQHVAGNLRSRFTEFLTTDGEKPWRHRDIEFVLDTTSRTTLMKGWSDGWTVLLDALDDLSATDLAKVVAIRRQPLTVAEALLRALAHVSYHVGQIVFIAKAERGPAWVSLSIPRGGSEAYNAAPNRERAPAGQTPVGKKDEDEQAG
jgi:hypothetical protein